MDTQANNDLVRRLFYDVYVGLSVDPTGLMRQLRGDARESGAREPGVADG